MNKIDDRGPGLEGRARTVSRVQNLAVAALTAPLLVACGDSTGPAGGDSGGRVALTVGLSAAVGSASTTAPSANVAGVARDLQFIDGTNTLDITRAALVLREIEFELQDDDGCDDGAPSSDCEKFEVGPLLLELPLDGGVETVITVDQVRPGVYDEVEFEIHKPDDDTAEDRTFLQSHPDFRRVSIRVEGRFNGIDFIYLSDLNEDQEIRLDPPLVVSENATTNATLTLDLGEWFRTSGGQLIDPATANDGGPNDNLVRDNIKGSIEGFEDRDSDGRR